MLLIAPDCSYLQRAATAVEELKEDITQEGMREVLLTRKLEEAAQAREALEREAKRLRNAIQKTAALLHVVERPSRQADGSAGPSLLEVWGSRRARYVAQLEQLLSICLLLATSAMVDGFMPAGEQHLLLCIAWDECAANGLNPPPTIQEVLDAKKDDEKKGAQPERYLLANRGGVRLKKAQQEKPQPKKLTKEQQAEENRNLAETRSMELYIKAVTTRAHAEAERAMIDHLVRTAEAACKPLGKVPLPEVYDTPPPVKFDRYAPI